MRNIRLLVVFSALLLLLAACGGQSAEEELLEQILENSGDDIGDVNIDLGEDGEGFNLNVTGDDGEDVTISGSGTDDEMVITVEGDDGGTMTIGGGEIPDELQIPVPPGGDVQTSIVSDSEILVSIVYDGDSYDELVEFYDSQLDAASDAVEKTETSFSTEDGTFRNVYYGPSEGSDWTVTVGDCMLGEPGICVNIIQSG
jgi:hypothetical protein